MPLIGIYAISNVLNNKKYIGSSNNIDNRIYSHKWHLCSNKHINAYLQNAWNKYGEVNFRIDVLEFCSEEELLSKERYWIQLLNTNKVEYGYNINVPLEDYNCNYIKCSKKTTKGRPSINKGVKRSITSIEKGIQTCKARRRKVLQLDKFNNIVKEYNSYYDVSFEFNCPIGTIRTAISNGRKAKGYYWKYVDND